MLGWFLPYDKVNQLAVSSVHFSCSVMSDSLWPHESQHASLSITVSIPKSPPCWASRLPLCPNPIPLVFEEWWADLPGLYSRLPRATYFTHSTSGKEPASQCRRRKRCGFDPWVGKILGRSAWQPAPVFLPAESHGWRSLVGYSPWGHKESGVTKWLSTAQNIYVSATISIHPSFSFPFCVHKSIRYICTSIPALQRGSSVPFSLLYSWLPGGCMLAQN